MGVFKLEAKAISAGIQKMTGISPGELDAALKGDQSAQDKILKYGEEIVKQAAVADIVITSMQDGMEAHGNLIKAKAEFYKSASTTLTSVQKDVRGVEKSDLQLQHSLKEVDLKHKFDLAELNQGYKRRLSLIPREARTKETIADIQYGQRLNKLILNVNNAREAADTTKKQLTPEQQTRATLRSLSGNVGKAGSGVGGFFGRVFNGLFGV